MENDHGFKDWFYQSDGHDEPRMVNFFDALMSEHMKILEGLLEVCYKTGYKAGWNDRDEVQIGLDG